MKERKDLKRMSAAMMKVKSPLKNGEGGDKDLKKMMREERRRAEDAKTGEMAWRSSQYTPSADPFDNQYVGFNYTGKGSAQPKSQETRKKGYMTYVGGERALPSDPKAVEPVSGIKPKSYWNHKK
jgi:hypothetical protein